MAIPWIRLIRSVPWQQVAKKAPEIADLAKKLWNTTYNKTATSENDGLSARGSGGKDATSQLQFFTENERIVSLEQKLAVIETNSSRLHRQLRESIELVTELAEQNAQLIKVIEINRRRILLLAGLTVLIGIIAAYSLYIVLR